MMNLKNIHFLIGLLTIFHFVITGLEMRLNLFSIDSNDTMTRMMFRANHIYILFMGLVNLPVSYTLKDERRLTKIQLLTTLILIASTVGLSISFYLEPTTQTFTRKVTAYSIQGCLLGTALHLLLLQFYYKQTDRKT